MTEIEKRAIDKMNIDEEIFKKLDEWVFNVETQAGEKLHVIDAIDLKEIIPEIMEVVNKFNYKPCCTELKCEGCKKPLNSGLCGSCCTDLASGMY